MARKLVIQLVVAVALVLPWMTAGPQSASAAPCDLIGNGQPLYDALDNEAGYVTVINCYADVYDSGGFMTPPSPGSTYYVLEIQYDAYQQLAAVPHWIYVANCNGYLSQAAGAFVNPFPGNESTWEVVPPGNVWVMDPGDTIVLLLFFEVADSARIAHTYFISQTETDIQLLDLSLDNGFAANADSGPEQMNNLLPNSRLRGCRAR